MTRNHPAEPGADHHRLGHRRLDRRRCSPAGCCPALCWRWCLRCAGGAGAATPGLCARARRPGDRRAPSSSPCRPVLPFVIRAAVIEGVDHGDRGFDRRHRLCRCWSGCALSPVRLAPAAIRCWCETAALSGAILLIIGAATAMAWALTQSGFSRRLAAGDGGCRAAAAASWRSPSSPSSSWAACWKAFRPSCCSARCCFPVARQLGVNEVHYAIVVMLAMGIGLFAPPFGVGTTLPAPSAGSIPTPGCGAIWPYLGAVAVGLLIVAAVPWISVGSP